jgi:LacI family transcriptional regulator
MSRPSERARSDRFGYGQAAATLADVAERAGVGAGTVSRVLNGSPMVREATRGRVEQAIRDLGYRPNRIARSLSRGHATAVGIVVPFFVRPSAVERVRGAERVLTSAGYDILLHNVSTPHQVPEQFRNAGAAAADGLLVISSPPIPAQIEELARQLPIVLIDVRYPDLPQIFTDDLEGGRIAARHLLELGHTRAGFVGDVSRNPFRFTSSAHRRRGFEEEMRAAGCRGPAVAEGEHSQQAAMELATRILGLPRPPTAIFAASDTQALGVLAAASAAGMRVPEDLSVIGFDDIEAATFAGLTTVRQPLEYSGERGARLLLDTIAGRRDPGPHEERLELSLAVRRTTGPPPRQAYVAVHISPSMTHTPGKRPLKSEGLGTTDSAVHDAPG